MLILISLVCLRLLDNLHVLAETSICPLTGNLFLCLDPQTQADLGAQYIIQIGLAALFPGITIIGEEDDDLQSFIQKSNPPTPDAINSSIFSANAASLSSEYLGKVSHLDDFRQNVDLIHQTKLPQELTSLDLKDIVLFIDPLDATRDYTKGRVENVTTLIGVAYHGFPLIGVIYYPFGNSCVYGGLGLGVFAEGLALAQPRPSQSAILSRHPFFSVLCRESLNQANEIIDLVPAPLPAPPSDEQLSPFAQSLPKPNLHYPYSYRIATTGSHFSPAVRAAFDSIGVTEADLLRVGGAGNKGVYVLTGKASAYIYPSSGTKRWDILAVDACVSAYGGQVTDIYGNSFCYLKSTPEEDEKAKLIQDSPYANLDGCLVTLDFHNCFLFPQKL